jgi:hypothetical protein
VYLVEQQLVPYEQVRDLLVDPFGAQVSLGVLVRWVQQAAQTLAILSATGSGDTYETRWRLGVRAVENLKNYAASRA